MALTATALLDGIAAARRGLTKFEDRQPSPGVVNAFQEGTEELVGRGQLENLRKSAERPVKVAVMNRFNGTIGNVRKLNPTPDTATSAFYTPSWFTVDFSFAQCEAKNAGNYIGSAEEFANLLRNEIYSAVLRDNTNSIEKRGVTFLEANKWTAPPASTVKGVSVASGAYVTTNEKLPILAPAIFAELNMGDWDLMDIANIGSLGRQSEMMAYGAANEKNYKQFLDRMGYYLSSRIAVTATYDETHYVAPRGTLGLLNWVEFDARNRTPHFNGEYMVVQDPYFGFNWGVRMRQEAKDMSATYGTGYERVVVTQYDFAADFAFVKSYSSVAGESPIVKFNTVTA